ncbi:c-di-AMP phosphodiesterase, consists of a GGDEF-like and DHH domains [Clostridium cavendishii DSM 21758]|uniref:Cyclic-di-AMP phosphodiesterase n=1 Tax=Clostridium cavendishii DSM 21758 TaxID=1121302 RepID=A0A1M6TIS7_9CLOT|nr:DHH family phosphoesterase [Clostridium cavendishii]SHK56871.1 c-di-AMP phosphodiesterase, consists of a GGDEF-like and DHH domains [Clostridium cavendishii DSM 21758]
MKRNKYKKNRVRIYSIIILGIAVLLWVFKLKEISLLLLGMYIVFLQYRWNISVLNENKLKVKVSNINNTIEESLEKNLLNYIYPLTIVKHDGEVIWYNKKFREAFNVENGIGSNLAMLARGIKLDTLLKWDKKYIQKIKFKKSIYEVYGDKIKIDDDINFSVVYFNDVTYLTEGTKESIVLIELDNLNEVIKTIEEIKAPLLIAEIETAINSYANNLKAMIKKYDNNKYILSVDDKVIESEINKKFDILDSIRDINLGNKMEVTLSIGVGRGGDTPMQNQNYAVTAKELALGRGGDQAVVKKRDSISFFGGNTKELEKRTRVRVRVVAHALKDLVYESNKVYIMGHKNPDMDCLGAAVGISSVIKQLGKPCKIILNEDIKAVDFFLEKLKVKSEYADLFVKSEEVYGKIDDDTLIIIVDVHSKNYVQDKEIINKAKKVVIIDHHRRSPDYIEGALLNYIEVYASSTSELVAEMVQYMLDRPKLSQIEAEGLLAGICMDTKNFHFKTGVRTFEAASFLRRLGADTIDIKKMFSNDFESFIAKANIVKSAEVENNMAIAVCPPNITQTVLAAQAADELLNITGIQASFVFVKIDSDIYISGRSLGDVNVQVVLEALGGGGHMTMAGAKLENIDMEEAKNRLKDAISKYLKEGD